MKLQSKFYIPLLLLCCIFIFFTNLDVIYVNIMEARNFITAREMLQYDNWIYTTMNLEPRYEKPPLPTWLTAFSASIFGLKSLFGLRLPAVFSVTFLIFTSYLISYKLLESKKQAFISALILASSFYIIFSGRNGQWDIFAHAFMLFAIYQLFQAFESTKKDWKKWMLAGLFLGLSFMSKGPVSLFALLLPFLIAYGIVFRYKNFKTSIFPLIISLLIFAVVGLSWGLYIYITDSSSAEAIAVKETAAWSNRSVRPFYYYWSFFIQSGLWTFFSFIGLLYPFMLKRVVHKKVYKFTFLWTLISVILLSLIPEKKERYLLPVLIPMALNTGFYIYYLIQKSKELKKVDSYISNFGFGLIALICFAFPIIGYYFFKDPLQGYYGYFISCSILLVLIGFIILFQLKKRNIEVVFYATVAMICVIMTVGLPMAKSFYDNENFSNISTLRSNKLLKNMPLFAYQNLTPELIWELGEPVKIVDKITDLPTNESFGLLLIDKPSDELNSNYELSPIDNFDINYINANKKGYKKRLTSKLYIASKK